MYLLFAALRRVATISVWLTDAHISASSGGRVYAVASSTAMVGAAERAGEVVGLSAITLSASTPGVHGGMRPTSKRYASDAIFPKPA